MDGIAGTVEIFLPEVGHWQHILFKHLAVRVISNSGIASIQAIKKRKPSRYYFSVKKVLQIIEAARKSADQYGQVEYV